MTSEEQVILLKAENALLKEIVKEL